MFANDVCLIAVCDVCFRELWCICFVLQLNLYTHGINDNHCELRVKKLFGVLCLQQMALLDPFGDGLLVVCRFCKCCHFL